MILLIVSHLPDHQHLPVWKHGLLAWLLLGQLNLCFGLTEQTGKLYVSHLISAIIKVCWYSWLPPFLCISLLNTFFHTNTHIALTLIITVLLAIHPNSAEVHNLYEVWVGYFSRFIFSSPMCEWKNRDNNKCSVTHGLTFEPPLKQLAWNESFKMEE